MLKQIGMSAGALKGNGTSFIVELKNNNPITLNMTFKRTFPITVKRMIISFRRQGLFVNNHVHNFPKFVYIHAAFFHQLELLSERLCKGLLQHRLVVIIRVIFNKVFPHFIKRIVPLCGNFPIRNSNAFLNGGYSLGIVSRISGNGIAVRGADRTFTALGKPVVASGAGFRREGKDNRPRWNFTGHVNSQPVACGYFYGLGNCHKENIA
jgi:hypothetical protein